MKNLKVFISSMAFFVAFSINANAISYGQSTSEEDSIKVWTSPELFDIATTWVSAYVKNNPEAKIIVVNIPANNLGKEFDISGSIGLVTKDYFSSGSNISNWTMALGRDIIVPVMHAENPYREDILKRGISPEEFAHAYTNIGKPVWGSLLNNDQSIPVNCYYFSNESGKANLANFFQSDLPKIKGKDVNSIDALLKEIHNDKCALGFCRLVDIIDLESEGIQEGIHLIPIDINGNNKIDHFENIYSNSNTLERGIWIGKYPKALYNNIYTVAGYQPIKSNELAFLKWTLTEGQQYLTAAGYSELISNERQSKVQSLYANPMPMIDVPKPFFTLPLFILVMLIVSGALILLIAIKYIKSKNKNVSANNLQIPKVFNESSVGAPNGYFFDKSHTWAFMEKDGDVRIGIADFLQHTTGAITKVNLKNPGEFVKKGEPFLTLIQQGKQLNIHSPISGKIKENNGLLNENSSIINSSPYNEGWVYVIESTNWLKEIKTFLMGESYRVWLTNEFYRLKHFFSSTIKINLRNDLQQAIQDGGELIDNPMENFGPEIWEEFQSAFINRRE